MRKRLLGLLGKLQKELNNERLADAFGQIQEYIHTLPEEEVAPEAKTKKFSIESFITPTQIEGKENRVALFADGACRGNPGPGAWGFVIQDHNGKVLEEGVGYRPSTTNNQMELLGVLEGMNALVRNEQLNSQKLNLFVFTDSQYVVNGMTSWVQGWKARGWKKADKKVPENLELWQQLDLARENFGKVEFNWVKGHAGHPQNEYCDQMANQVLDENGH